MDESPDIIDEQSELYEHHRVVADPGQSLLRVDKFLFNHIAHVSRNKIQQAARAGNILVNSQQVKPNYRVHPGDVVSVVLTYPPREIEIIPQQIDLDIVYEDKDTIVINKQAGLVVHPGHGNYSGTLLNGLAYHFNNSKQPVENGYGYLVHRIDKDTTGLILAAKNENAQTRLARQFYDRVVDRTYQALVWGDFESDDGTIEGHIGRSMKDRRQMGVFPDGSYGKHAVTHFSVLQRFGYVTLVECKLETGRTHQIRAHFKFIGHPLFNDERYGGDQILKGTTFTRYRQFVQNCFKLIPRQALHAKSLGFIHPTSGKKLHFDSVLPADMQQAVEKWAAYAAHQQSL